MGTPLAAFLFLAAPAHAGCDPDAIDQALAAAERSFVAGDARSLGVDLRDVKRTLACLREPVGPRTCARVHRARALEASLAGDQPAALASLRAMLHADPLITLPPELVPARQPLRAALVQAEEATLSFADGPAGAGWLFVDGMRTGAVPVGQPYVLQRTKPDGRMLGAKLVDQVPRAGGESARASADGRSTRTAVRWAGAGFGVVGAGLYGAAWAANGAYHDAVAARDDARIGRTHTTTNALSVSSVASASVGAALLAASFAL